MSRFCATWSAIVVAGLIATQGCSGRPPSPDADQTSGRPRGANQGGAAPLLAEGRTIELEPVLETVPTLGTLLANESVTIVAESARRVSSVQFEEGALVQKGTVLFKLDDASLKADLVRLEGRRGLALSTEARQAELVKQKLVSTQDYDRAESELKAIQGELEGLKVEIAKTEIRAPFTGRVGLRRVSEGAYVNPNTVLTTLQDVSQLKLDFALPERYSDEVRKGQPFTFRVESRSEPFTGHVVAVEPAINTATRSLVVRGVVPNPSGHLVPGGAASVEFNVNSADGILIPSRALVPSIKGHSVFVLKNGKAAEQEVTIGMRTEDRVQIVSGLRKGDVVLTSNLLRLRAGIAVQLDRRSESTP